MEPPPREDHADNCSLDRMSQRFMHVERRADHRYRFGQPLWFSYSHDGWARLGAGQSIELGSAGLLFQSDYPPPDGSKVELHISWPLLVQDICAAMLVIDGTVVRTDWRGTAVRMDRYLFQTIQAAASGSLIDSGAVVSVIG